MTDIVDPETRSRMMSGIRGKNTRPEILVRSLLHRRGFRFRINVRDLPGKPDVVLPKYHAVIFINGCFWHGHDCPLVRMPGTREDFWKKKIEDNRTRDRKTLEALAGSGWRVGIVWECALRGKDHDPEKVVTLLEQWLTGNEQHFEARK